MKKKIIFAMICFIFVGVFSSALNSLNFEAETIDGEVTNSIENQEFVNTQVQNDELVMDETISSEESVSDSSDITTNEESIVKGLTAEDAVVYIDQGEYVPTSDAEVISLLNVKAYDIDLSDITDSVTIKTEYYYSDEILPGKYDVEISVEYSDESTETITKSIDVEVDDLELTVNDITTSTYYKIYNLDDVKSEFEEQGAITVSDYTDSDEVVIIVESNDGLVFEEGEPLSAGVYEFLFSAQGSNGNVVSETATLTVESEDDYIFVLDYYLTNISNAPKTESDILEGFNALVFDEFYNEVYDNIFISDYDGYNFNNPEVGEYLLTFESIDGTTDPVQSTMFIVEDDADLSSLEETGGGNVVITNTEQNIAETGFNSYTLPISILIIVIFASLVFKIKLK